MPVPQRYLLKSGETRWRIRYRTSDNRSTDKGGFPTKKAAELWFADTVLAKSEGRFSTQTQKKTRLSGYIERHVNRTVKLSPSTVANRKSVAATWVTPEWGNWAVSKIRRRDVEDWVERLHQEEVSAAVIQKAHGILLAALNAAQNDKLIHSNPASRITLPKAAKAQNVYLTHEQVIELGEAVDPRYRALVAVLAYLGLRFGEASALRVGSVDLEKRRLSITRSSTIVDGRLVEGPPKGGKLRDLYFPAFLATPIRSQMVHKKSTEYLFTSERGSRLRLDDWRPRVFYAAIEKINKTRQESAEKNQTIFEPFPAITPHDLRHTAASLAVSSGANVKAIQRMLGHASASMTLDRYADLFDDDLRAVSAALDRQAQEKVDVAIWSNVPTRARGQF